MKRLKNFVREKVSESTLTEDTEKEILAKFLLSRGINPEHVTKDVRIAHSKSNDFIQYKNNHATVSESRGHKIIATKLKDIERKMQQGKPIESKKPADVIKDALKKKVNEELQDWEKQDKSVQVYGKKPKLNKTESDKEVFGDKKPVAAAVLSGGKTLTGEPRDDIEIDPVMRRRPNQPINTSNAIKKQDT